MTTAVKVDTDEDLSQEEYENQLDDGSVKAKPLQPDWANAPTVTTLKRDVSEADPDFQMHVQKVKGYISLRDGELKVKIAKGKSKVSPKLIRKQNEWRYASLSEPFLSDSDLFDVEPATYADKEGAIANAIVLNRQMNEEMDRVSFVDKYIRTAVDEGVAFLRVGWELEEEEVTKMQPVMAMGLPPEMQEQLSQMQQGVQAGQVDPAQFQQAMAQAKQHLQPIPTGEMEEVTETIVTKNIPTLSVVDYDKVMIDPTCDGVLDNARFIVTQMNSSRSELRVDDKYSNIEAITESEDNPLSYADDNIENQTFQFEDKARKELLVTEYWGDWDIHDDGTTVPIVAAYAGNTMIRLEENPFPDQKPPFIKVVYLPKRRDVYGGEPDAVLIEDNQDVIGAVSRGMIDLMGKSANAQQGVSADALDPAQKLRYEQGKDYIFNPGVDPSKAFFMGTYPEIPRSAMEMIQMQNADAESLTGVKAFTDGISGQALGSTATGIRSALDATSKRELGILRRLSAGLEEAGKKIIAMNAVNLSDEEIIRDTDGEFVTISRDALAGKYDLKLSISTPEKDNEKSQDLAFMLQTIGNGMDPELQQIILADIAHLKEMPLLAKKLIDYEPKPDPAQERIQELQIQLLEAQVANERAQGAENNADVTEKTTRADLNAAKARTEDAKVRNLNSNSDGQDLEFLQRKDGTQHKQGMEAENQKFENEIQKKGADSLLSTDTPNQSYASDNATQELSDQDILGMNTPEENLADQMLL